MRSLNTCCLLRLVCFWVANCLSDTEDSYRDEYNETCQLSSQCPDLMHCNEDALCACDIGLSFSHSSSKCERAKKMFTDFFIQGPSIVNLPVGRVELKAMLGDQWGDEKWTFSWTILNGMDNARFAGMDGPSLTLTELKPGFVQLTLSVSNDTSEGYMLHNLIIAEERDHSVKIVDCDEQSKAARGFLRLWLPRDNSLRLCSFADKAASLKWVRVDHSLYPLDISGSTSSTLELSNFQPTNETNPYEFFLSVSFDDGHSSNSTVKIFVRERPDVPVIYVQNVTVPLHSDSVLLNALVLNGSVDVFMNFTWVQTDGPSQVALANRHSLSSASTVGPFNASGLYVFRVRGVTVAEDVSEAVVFIDVRSGDRDQPSPVVSTSNFSVFLPRQFIFLKPTQCRNGDNSTWEPDGRVPAVMLLQSDFHSPKLFLSHLLLGTFTFTLFCHGHLGNTTSTIVRLEVKERTKSALFSLDIALRREQTDEKVFLFREQKNFLETMEKLLLQNLGGRLMSDVNDLFYDGNVEILTLRLAITHSPDYGEGRANLTEAKMASILQSNNTFLEQFKIASISPTTKCLPQDNDECGPNEFSMSDFLTTFFVHHEPNLWQIFYAWLTITVIFTSFFKYLHFLWRVQEGGESEIVEKLKQNFCGAIGWKVPVHMGRCSPISSLRKFKNSSVNKALLNENGVTSLDTELSRSASDYEEEEETADQNGHLFRPSCSHRFSTRPA